MDWQDVEAAIRAYLEVEWPLTAFTNFPLVWENEVPSANTYYMAVNIEGFHGDKSLIGSVGKRISIELGLVFFHSFIPFGIGKQEAISPVVKMTQLLQLSTLNQAIKFEGGNPPSTGNHGDTSIPSAQPGGAYFRCSGSVPFRVIGTV